MNINDMHVIRKRGRRPKSKQRYLNTQTEQISYVQSLDKTVNQPKTFTYMDYIRNENLRSVIKKHYQQMIRINGVDLVYFRKYNTFFKQGQQNKANMIYGQDTTAQYYASGDVRAFLDISTYNWLFNQMGYQTQQNINLYIGIQDFRCRFTSLIGRVKKQRFYVPVEGDRRYNQLHGVIDCPEFYAKIYGRFYDDLRAINIYPQVCQRPVGSKFYKSVNHKTIVYPITGFLDGQLYCNQQSILSCSGILSGDLLYHSFDSIQDNPFWKIAPQVGDYFRMTVGQIQEQYQVTQIFDRILQNNGGINPLLGKYIFQIQAVRRSPSHQDFQDITNQNELKDQEDILNELHHTVKQFKDTVQEEQKIVSVAVKQGKNQTQNIQYTDYREQPLPTQQIKINPFDGIKYPITQEFIVEEQKKESKIQKLLNKQPQPQIIDIPKKQSKLSKLLKQSSNKEAKLPQKKQPVNQNKTTNKVARGMYNYDFDQDDYIYGRIYS